LASHDCGYLILKFIKAWIQEVVHIG